MSRADEIENAVLIIHGASHTDLYDNLAVIPFDKMEAFFQKNLK